ncbi:CCC motif membrane protein [Capnocytophaga stomatis]|uniref:CCC motif membrane protein n=1 Tax=Capnocytophaga stomatis TaxID=1848904 RepID=A0A250FUQ6_9FLAO|nr:CCC motif membrane protein [Capnocytophaga stomatis]ATA88892.1 hypothetical protein CGC58_03625 [Capnocytophaga stomatis]GIJ94462.1 hypothetical protein CAPN002_16800 [Capnocytophaga stomatis]GIJ95693.1 hypothetical protein CAPN001_02620 [Capnocytophaga stomatis]GIM48927.1 hypothetical protein CAPN003_03790 [Capnocytophaga stomatis]
METNDTFNLNFGQPSDFKKSISTTLIYVLAILGAVFSLCCCVGIIPSIIAVVIASNRVSQYQKNPSAYTGYDELKTARIVAFVALGINILVFLWILYSLFTTDWSEIMRQYEEILQNAQNQ